MWDKWKKRIENFIWKEVEVEVEEEDDTYIQYDERSPIQAKIAYKYPSKDAFQIPSHSIKSNKPSSKHEIENIPAYKRRNRIRQEEQIPHEQNKRLQRTKEETPIKKRAPFKVNEVASPIYGYQKRQEKREVSIPAYKRKNAQRQTSTEFIQPLKEVASTMEERKEQHSYTEQTHEASSTVRKFPEQEISKRTTQQTQTAHNQVAKLIPFNVLMTSEDKQKIRSEQSLQMGMKQQEHIQTEKQAFTQHTEMDSAKIEESELEKPISTMPLHLLNDLVNGDGDNHEWIEQQQVLLEQTLQHFKIRAKVVNISQGPSVTRFEVQPELGVKVSRIKNLSDDLKLNMAAKDIRIEAPIPGKNTIGIEVPNLNRRAVSLLEIFETEAFKQSEAPLTVPLGLDVEGTPVMTNIQKMPHGLIAGATGSGKSVCINTIMISLLYKASHEDVKFLLIDPKMVELAPYHDIPHLIAPVITDVKAATAALKWAVAEMERRYELFVKESVRDMTRYNEKMRKQNRPDDNMPYLIIVIDELADLMMVSPQDVEDAICRIAQKARACGIHLLLATQRPSVDVITGLIKANIPTRIAFSVSSQVDSRTMIDHVGAEKLLGKGDMLFVENGAGKSIRLQGAFVSDEEIERVTAHVRKIAPPQYEFEQEALLEQVLFEEEEDELLHDAIEFVMEHQSASTSLLQRRFKIGYNRAARLIDSMEAKGIISGQNGSKPREVLITSSQFEQMNL